MQNVLYGESLKLITYFFVGPNEKIVINSVINNFGYCLSALKQSMRIFFQVSHGITKITQIMHRVCLAKQLHHQELERLPLTSIYEQYSKCACLSVTGERSNAIVMYVCVSECVCVTSKATVKK